MEPHYWDPYHVSDFIDVAADAAGPGHTDPLPVPQDKVEERQ